MHRRAHEIMTTTLVTTSPHATVEEAARLLVEHRISGMPVLHEGRLVGIVTEADLTGVTPGEAWVGDLMTREIISVTPDTPVPEVASLLAEHRIKRVPVVEADGTLVGLISRADIVAWIAQGAKE